MSTNTGWRYAINTFEVNTRGTNVKMLSLSTDTHAKLKAEESNPAIADILLIYEPVFIAYRDLDQQYGLKSGDYEGFTIGFEEYLDQIPHNLRVWEGIIRAIYIEDSAEEHAIFPNKRTPFLNDTYEKRLDALGTLKLKTAADPALAAANTLITSFYNAALGARLAQQTHEGSLNQLSDLREDQRVILSKELTGVLGKLMFIHRLNLNNINRYFDLTLLRDTTEDTPPVEQTVFNGTLGGGVIFGLASTLSGISSQFTPDTVFRLKNTSTDPSTIIYYAANSPTDPPGPGAQYPVTPGVIVEKTFAELGLASFSDFNIKNTAGFTISWEVEVVL